MPGENDPIDPAAEIPDYVIQEMGGIHCARGPKWCPKCREMAQNVKFRLLKIHHAPTGHASPVIQVPVDGTPVWFEYDVERVFETEAEARAYADRHDVPVRED